ncbi:sensor histidine kinase [Massilia sp. TN1-12]|uniref:sensor histidine kinase n=1 Tax=Massilia paldalensis TaxID=3377675 RepID=UPI00384DB900
MSVPPRYAPDVDLVHASWSAREGAPTGITGIAQTPDGWIWIGSASGLFRFDGVRFLRATGKQAPLSSNISAIGMLKDGTMWVGYKYGGVSLMRDGQMRHFGLDDPDTPAGTIFCATRDASGRLWLATSRGLVYFDGKWRRPAASLDAPAERIYSLLFDGRGVLWARGETAVFMLPKGGSRFLRQGALNAHGVIMQHPDGSVWTTNLETHGLRMLAPPEHGKAPAWNIGIAAGIFIFDRKGQAWMDSVQGVLRVGHAPDGAPVVDRLGDHAANAFFEDREGNIWAGTENGLDRYKASRIRAAPMPAYTANNARPVAGGPGGGAWTDRVFAAAPGGPFRAFMPEPGNLNVVTALYRARDDTVWLGRSDSWLGTLKDGKVQALPLPPGLSGPAFVNAFAQDGGGTMWVSMGRRGLYAWRAGQWSAGGGVPDLASFAATTIAADTRGRVWLGSVNDQIAVLENGRVRRYGRADGLAIGTVVQVVPSGGGAWVGGENGLAHFDGQRFTAVAGAGGEPFAGITGMVFDRRGTLWLNGGNGISGIAPAELQRALGKPGYPVRFRRLDYRDGVAGTTSPIIPVPSATRSDDGTLWFSTTRGVYAFDPDRLPRNTLVPPVAILGLTSGGAIHAPTDGARLPAGTETLEIDFTALSYQESERMEFRYRLDGVDADWRDSDGRRTASYTNLKPGRYRFQVIASNNDGVWNTDGAAMGFEIAPRTTETVWFRVLCGAAGAGLLAGLYAWRTRRLARRYGDRLRDRLAERERIARALHDTLLQSMQALILRFHGVAKRLPAGSEAQQGIEEILDQADKVMTEGRNELLNLRSQRGDHNDIGHALARFGQSLQEQFGPTFTLVATGTPRAIEPGARDEIYWIGREALFNAYQHAHARHVEAEIVYGDERFGLFVRDDGAGMPDDVGPDGSKEGHWGVAGMRERAHALGGMLDIWSRSRLGTELALQLPGQRVYAAPRRPGPGRRLRAWLGRIA